MAEKQYDIFISYSKKDTSKIEPLREVLDKTDIKYWIDDYIGGSEKWIKEIPLAIKKCKILLYVASQDSASSVWTQKEILYAQKYNKEIYPYKLSDFSFDSCPELDFFFTNIQWKESVDEVVNDLLKKLGRKRIEGKEEERNIEREAYLLSLPDEEFVSFKANGRLGFILKSTNEIVIPCKYDAGFFLDYRFWWLGFKEGLVRVRLNDKWGFIDKTGREVISLKYDRAYDFCEGLAKVKLNGKYGFIDKIGKEIIPLKYDDANSFSEGLACVELEGKYGFVDKIGKEIIPLEYDDANSFSEGLACVELSGRYGFIDTTGKVVIPLKYDYATSFMYSTASVKLNGEEFYIDKNGNKIE